MFRKCEFRIGDRVKHNQFGEGDIIDLYPLGEDVCAVVSFEKLGQKKLVLRYAKLSLVKRAEEETEPEVEEVEATEEAQTEEDEAEEVEP